ncbi:hypothetical protein TEA_012918 [Camellia sinensis var. sinensis]|uniref:Ribosomal protein L34Ae n=1 Tax=Camellia sinensis var. sinensis TaxID=542762 RepID=A0A4S4DPV3_CAMSN|nr:hypothetical protein TEA_012918 [Camellia sinensis var. sinensis]
MLNCVVFPFRSVDMGSDTQFLYQNFVLFVGIFCFSVSTYFFPLFDFFKRYLFRSSEDNSKQSEVSSAENSLKDSIPIEPKTELQPWIHTGVESKQEDNEFSDGLDQKQTPEFSFKFKFPTFEEFNRNRKENGGSISFEAAPDTSIAKYEFMPVKCSSDSIEEPEVVSFNAEELNTDMDCCPFDDKDSVDDGFLADKDFMQINSETKTIHQELSEDLASDLGTGDVSEKIEAMAFMEEKGQDVSDEILHSEMDSFAMDSDSESISSSPLRLIMNRLIDSYSDGFLSDGDFGGEFMIDNSMDIDGEKVEDHHLDDSSGEHKEDNFEEDVYTMEELEKLEVHFRKVGKLNSDFLSGKDFLGGVENSKHEEVGGQDDKPADPADDSEKPNSKNASEWDSEESNKLETLWEHQELIEQLKMELKKVRATGLPTILEESESPKIMEDLKPWKIDEKFQHADRMGELHKFYKSYRERMRKFDILNYQKMYAIGFLQLKDPLQSISTQKSSSVPSIASLLPQNLNLGKRSKKIGSDPMMKFIRELQSELEVVYVGQMCLSWEILHWQYGKALELWENDPRCVRQYNEVAGEFQQFQVLLQRFIEDEPFQAPRVQNYVKSRCVLRNLLQVPVIREDSTKDRKKAIKVREYSITSDMLVEILEESIRIFWRFVRADKDCSIPIVKCQRGPHVEFEDPTDSDLLREIRANLQKKEKKLKELLRSGKCILKRFQKCQEGDSEDQVLYFFSQVDMKLVSRVLNMSRISTDQLLWCRNKLTKISFVNRKIRVEPSFLLFPC